MNSQSILKNKYLVLCIVLLAAVFLMVGCKGDAGDPGDPGATGPEGPQGGTGPAGGQVVDIKSMTADDLAALKMTIGTPQISMASQPAVTFTVTDQAGRGVTGLGLISSTTNTYQLYYLRFGLAKLVLVPGTYDSPDRYRYRWESYMIQPTGRGVTTAEKTPTLERNGVMVDNGDGSYTYTFATPVVSGNTNTWAPAYDASATTRFAIQLSASNNPFPPVNYTYDYVPAGGTPTQRDIVNVASCKECHMRFTFHGGARQDTKLCVVCHTLQRANGAVASALTPTAPTGTYTFTDSSQLLVNGFTDTSQPFFTGQAQLEFVTFIHKIHRGDELALQNYSVAGVELNEHTYPQDRRNCRKCHNTVAQADNWKNKPSRKACGACHDNITWNSPAPTGFALHASTLARTGSGSNTDGIAKSDDSECTGCHQASGNSYAIEDVHLTNNATPNNPLVPAGLVNFTYEISSVTVTVNFQPEVTFRILAGGTPVSLICNSSSSTTANTLLNGFSGSPAFLAAYTLPQDGISAPADYNNLGKSEAQPASVSIANVCNGSQGSMTGPDGSGYYTATLNGSSNAARFPDGAIMRAVALQGNFTQSAGTNGIAANTARQTKQVIKAVTGDTVRREVVDSDKCAKCHEWLALHGGSRVYNVQVCIVCHNPNNSSNGRGADPANMDQANRDAMTADGYNPDDPSTYPEATVNFKNMIHGLHASDFRTTPYQFVRNRGTAGVFYYNWSHVTFPGILSNCETCHKPGTYDVELPAGVLATTNITTDGDPATTDAQDRASLPNAADEVISPTAATCVPCHDSALAKAHITQFGGYFGQRTGYNTVETCVICHGPGRVADVTVIHPK